MFRRVHCAPLVSVGTSCHSTGTDTPIPGRARTDHAQMVVAHAASQLMEEFPSWRIGAAIGFFGLLLLVIIAYAGWSANQTATERERTLLKNAFNQSIARALNEQKSVAWWDDSVLKITDQTIDLDFVDANFGIFLTETYGHDEVYILNADDRPLYAFSGAERRDPSSFEHRRASVGEVIGEARRGEQTKLRRRPDSFTESQSNYRKLAGVLQVARWAGHIISVDGQPAVIAALTIVPNAGSVAVTRDLCVKNVFRTSFTNWQPAYGMGVAAAKKGYKKGVWVTWDYAAGAESGAGFKEAFEKSGERYLLSAQYRLGGILGLADGTWLSLSYGNGYGTIGDLKSHTALVTLSYSPPKPPTVGKPTP